MGRDFPFDDCGRAFTCLPVENPQAPVEALVCNLDRLLDIMTHRLGPGSPPGVWVSSTDMLLSVPPNPGRPLTSLLTGITWDGFRGARVIAFPGTTAYAQNHGVYLTDAQGFVLDIHYQASEADLQRCARPDGRVPLVGLCPGWGALRAPMEEGGFAFLLGGSALLLLEDSRAGQSQNVRWRSRWSESLRKGSCPGRERGEGVQECIGRKSGGRRGGSFQNEGQGSAWWARVWDQTRG
uniref:GDP-fucose pyrophosphorylase domain-containing protein n=1 Tax=Pipistrellus kuhlii TaxID=59472 RepID=A0A7J7V070_PIPKU|nr:hypothetical protein mPipKuh1_005279 [Pipistrellus kuhlii]